MNLKSVILLALSMSCLSVSFTSCTSNKAAFGNAYYFKQTPRTTAEKLPPSRVEPLPESHQLSAMSAQLPANDRDVKALMDNARKKLMKIAGERKNEKVKASSEKISALTESIEKGELSKKEIKSQRKELRKELKNLKKEYKSMAPEETQEMDNLILLTIILAAGGLVFILLSGIVPALGIIGLLALIGSLVTLIIWAAKQ
jgi:hypothetical protein